MYYVICENKAYGPYARFDDAKQVAEFFNSDINEVFVTLIINNGLENE